MNSKNGAVARRFLIALGIMLTMAAVILGVAISPTAFASFYSTDGKPMGTGELIFDADGNASSIYIYGNTIPISLDTLEGMVTVALCNDPSLGTATTLDTFVLEGTNAKLVKDSCSNLGIDDVEIKLAIFPAKTRGWTRRTP